MTDDTVLVADSQVNLRCLVREFVRVCQRRNVRVHLWKSEVRKLSVNEEQEPPRG